MSQQDPHKEAARSWGNRWPIRQVLVDYFYEYNLPEAGFLRAVMLLLPGAPPIPPPNGIII